MERHHKPSGIKAAFIGVLLVGALTSCTQQLTSDDIQSPTRDPQTVSSSAACVFSTPAEAELMFNAHVTPNSDVGGWIAGDGYVSAPLTDGNTLFLFGDSFIGTTMTNGKKEQLADASTVNSAGLIYHPAGNSEGECLTDVGTSRTELLVDPTADGENSSWWWPGTIIPNRDDPNVLTVLAYRMARTGAGAWDSSISASGVFTFIYNPGEETMVVSPPTVFSGQPGGDGNHGTMWAAATYQTGKYTYVYGTQRSREPFVFGRAVHVARIPARSDIGNQKNWEYKTPSGAWHAKPTQLATLIPADGGTSTVFSVAPSQRDIPTLITKEDEFLGTKVTASTLPSPASSPTQTRTLFTTPESSPKNLTYMPLSHPSIPAPAGKIWVTLNRNKASLAATSRNVGTYQASWHLVPIS